MRAISAAVLVSSAIGFIARRAIAMPATSASRLPASTPSTRNNSTRLQVASVAPTWRPYSTITRPIGSSLPLRVTSASRLMTR